MFVPKTKPYISFIGRRNLTASPVITWNSKSSDRGPNGQELGTYGSATVAVESDFFCATEVTFEVSKDIIFGIVLNCSYSYVVILVIADKCSDTTRPSVAIWLIIKTSRTFLLLSCPKLLLQTII